MDQTPEQIPIPALVAGFAFLFIGSNFLRRKLRERMLIKEGQLSAKDGRVPSIEERVAGNAAWAKGEIPSKGRTLVIFLWITAVVINVMFCGGFIKSLSNPAITTAPIIVLGIFSCLGIAFLIFTIRCTLQYFRFGESVCCISGKAGVLEKKMSGIIRNKNEINPTGDYTIELQCLESYTTGSGKNKTSKTKIHWQAQQKIAPAGKSSKAGIPFSFDLPKFAYETGYQLSNGSVDWYLRIHAPAQGVDYSAQFIVPVFKM